MINVLYPEPDFKVRKEKDQAFLFDTIRKAWVRLTEEEWVRQNFIQYLIRVKQYPAELIAIEKEIKLHELRKRFDILIYNAEHVPWMLVECKAPQVKLSEDVLRQALHYHMSVPVNFIIITNGETTAGWEKKDGRLWQIDEVPARGGAG